MASEEGGWPAHSFGQGESPVHVLKEPCRCQPAQCRHRGCTTAANRRGQTAKYRSMPAFLRQAGEVISL